MEKDIYKAVEILEPTLSNGQYWFKTDYIDALLLIGTSESERKAFDYTESLRKENKSGALARLACMYHDGVGTERSIERSYHYMKQAASKNPRDFAA